MAYGIDLLSAEEQKTLKPIIGIMNTVLKMNEVSKTNDADDALNQKMNADFEALCKKKRLNRQKLLDLAVKVMNSKWFCVYLTGGTFDKDGTPMPLYSFVTSDHPDVQTEITSEEYPDFFTIGKRISSSDKNIREAILTEYRSALNLAKEYKSIDADHVDAVLSIYEIFGNNPRKITVRPLKYGLYLADKVNAQKLWGLTEKVNKKHLFVGYDSASVKGKRVGIGLMLNFDGVSANMTKSLTKYDKYVYSMVYTLYMSGYHTMTASMIYSMGSNTRPNKQDIKKINDALTKMGVVRVFVDNSKERKEYPSYPPFSYDEILLDFVRISKKEEDESISESAIQVNGYVSESYIRIKTEPIMGRFARERKQIRKVDIKLLNPPLSKTERNLAISDYLMYVTSYSPQPIRKILHETFFDRIGVTDRRQKVRALEAAEKVLAYYKQEKWIVDYTMETDGIVIVKKLEAEKLPGQNVASNT